jgi:hypothetical protein
VKIYPKNVLNVKKRWIFAMNSQDLVTPAKRIFFVETAVTPIFVFRERLGDC